MNFGDFFLPQKSLKMRDVFEKMRECGKLPNLRDFPHDCGMVDTYGIRRIALRTADVKTWMASHNLQKTEVVVIAARNRSRVHRPVVVSIDVCGVSVTPKPSIRDIGVEIDDTMSMAVHVRRVCQVAYCHIRSIAKIRKCLTTAACKTIVHIYSHSKRTFLKKNSVDILRHN